MTTVLTVANRKGGVAKTTASVNLAHGLALEGKTVMLVDTDPQGHVAPALGPSR
jgi:chromosome partitioning protein